VLARQLAFRGKVDVKYELQRLQLAAQRFGQAPEVLAFSQVDVGIGLAQALVDVGVHGPLNDENSLDCAGKGGNGEWKRLGRAMWRPRSVLDAPAALRFRPPSDGRHVLFPQVLF